MKLSSLWWVVCATLLLCSCGSEKDVDPPKELVAFKSTIKVKKLWSARLGGDADHLRLALQVAVVAETVYAAAQNGEVSAFSAASGKRLWHAQTGLPLSAGPGVGEALVVVGTSDGYVVALDAQTGHERWRQFLAGEILAPPLVAQGLVIVRTVNGRLHALSVADAQSRWVVEETMPRLSLRGTAPPVLAKDLVVAGFDNGKLLGVDINNGDTVWSTTVDVASGRTELDRLIDIDAPAVIADQDVYVVGYQGRVAMLELETGQIWWAKEASSYRGFVVDESALYLSSADSNVKALRRIDGTALWEQAALHQRRLSAPALTGRWLVVGDYEGYVHWLDKTSGELVARAKADGVRISQAPVVVADRVFVQTDGGTIIAYQTAPLKHNAVLNSVASNNKHLASIH